MDVQNTELHWIHAVFISMNVEEDSAMFDAVWYLDCILPSSVALFMEWMGYRFLKGEKQSLDDVSA